MTNWFQVDKAGLAKLLERKGKGWVLYELLQNCWDTDATRVEVALSAVPGRPLVKLKVEDDHPDGFHDLSHAWTLFAESSKKTDPGKRGRFNLGEKLVLALCEEATIWSTTGMVTFNAKGRTVKSHQRRERGTVFSATLRMTRDELDRLTTEIERLLPPMPTFVNGTELFVRHHIESFKAMLPTEVADDEGYLRRIHRMTRVTVHEPRPGQPPHLYEMGIPVVELTGGERWDVNIGQKIPLTMERDNVTPTYLQSVRLELAAAVREQLTASDARTEWVRAVTGDARIDPAVMRTALDLTFGERRASYDPSDPEANKQLQNEGYTVVPGGALSAAQWANAKSHGLIEAAGKVRPSGVRYDPNGPPEAIIDPSSYTDGQYLHVQFAKRLFAVLLPAVAQRMSGLRVRIVNEPIARPHLAWYGDGVLTLNLGRLGKAWFEQPPSSQHLELLLHEFAHHAVGDHLTLEFADEVARLAARAVQVALDVGASEDGPFAEFSW